VPRHPEPNLLVAVADFLAAATRHPDSNLLVGDFLGAARHYPEVRKLRAPARQLVEMRCRRRHSQALLQVAGSRAGRAAVFPVDRAEGLRCRVAAGAPVSRVDRARWAPCRARAVP
jgi:hypothetical protein